MPLFIVATTEPATDTFLKSRFADQFPDDHHEIGKGQWLASFEGTARGLFERLEDENSALPLNGCLVLAFGGYWGRASSDTWEWIRAKLGGKSA